MYHSGDKSWNSLFRNEKGCVYLIYFCSCWVSVVCSCLRRRHKLVLYMINRARGNLHGLLWRSGLFTGLVNQQTGLQVEWALKNKDVLEKHLGLRSTVLLLGCTFPKQVLWRIGRTVCAYSGPLFFNGGWIFFPCRTLQKLIFRQVFHLS